MHPWGRTAGDAHAGMHSCTLSFRGHRSSQTDPPPSHPQPRSAGAPPAPPQAHSHQQPGPQPPPPVLTQFLKRENDRSSCPAPPAHHRLQLRAQHRGSNTATPPLPHPPPPPHPDAVHPPKQRTDAFPTAPVGSPRIPAVPFRAGPRRWGGGSGMRWGGAGPYLQCRAGPPARRSARPPGAIPAPRIPPLRSTALLQRPPPAATGCSRALRVCGSRLRPRGRRRRRRWRKRRRRMRRLQPGCAAAAPRPKRCSGGVGSQGAAPGAGYPAGTPGCWIALGVGYPLVPGTPE